MKFYRVEKSFLETLLSKCRDLPLNSETFENDFPWKKSKCEHYQIRESNKEFLEYLLTVLQQSWDKDITMDFLNKSYIKFIIYDVNEKYFIDPHEDNCEKTLIFYLQKDPSIQDHVSFDVTPNCKYVPGDLGWEYGLSEFDGNITHGGSIHGSSLQVLLSIHH